MKGGGAARDAAISAGAPLALLSTLDTHSGNANTVNMTLNILLGTDLVKDPHTLEAATQLDTGGTILKIISKAVSSSSASSSSSSSSSASSPNPTPSLSATALMLKQGLSTLSSWSKASPELGERVGVAGAGILADLLGPQASGEGVEAGGIPKSTVSPLASDPIILEAAVVSVWAQLFRRTHARTHHSL